MASLSLREAAHEVGISKSTILRAIQSGRLLAPRKEDGGYAIDPAELFRVYKPKDAAPTQESPADDGSAAPISDAAPAELTARMAALEIELRGLKDLLAKANQPRPSWWKRLVG
jgi:excisionase family DNA binding protein